MKRFALGLVVAIAIAVSAFAVEAPKVGHAEPTCSGQSTLLKAYAKYFTFDGTTDGALYQIAVYGVWSAANPQNDCLYAKVTYTGEAGNKLWAYSSATAYVSGLLWYSPSPGSWDPCSCAFESTKFTGGTHGTPYSVMQSAQEIYGGDPDNIGGDCIVVNAVGDSLIEPSQFYDASGTEYIAGSNAPGNDTPVICPS